MIAMRVLLLLLTLSCLTLALPEKKQLEFSEYFAKLSPEEKAYAAKVAAQYASESFNDEFPPDVDNAKKEMVTELLEELKTKLEKKEKAQYVARSLTQYYMNDFLGARQMHSGPAYDGLTKSQEEFAEDEGAEYFAKALDDDDDDDNDDEEFDDDDDDDEFDDDDVDDAKRGRGKGRKKKPNIIFFLIDDLGYNDVPWTNPEVIAPYMMDLATNGVILEKYYAAPVCSPSRGAVMTGKYAWRIGMHHSVLAFTTPDCAPHDVKFISEKLKDAGYATHALGKWHLGFCKVDCTPTYRGFDTFYGFYQGYIDHYSHVVAGGYDWWDNVAGGGETSRQDLAGQFAGDLLTDRAVEIINNHDTSTPMYMYFSHSSVHTPIQAPEKYTSQYSGLDTHRATYLGMVTGIDDSVKQVTEALKARGMYDNTVIIFTSDNGAEFSAGSNGNLRGSKTTFYEAGIKVPGFIHSPRVKVPGRSDGLMHISDWHATILSMAGLDSSGLDGVDQKELLFNGGGSARHSILLQIDSTFPQFLGAEAILVGDYKLLRGFPGLYDGYESDGTLGLTHIVDLIGGKRGISLSANQTIRRHHEELKRQSYNFDWAAIAGYIHEVRNEVQLFNIRDDPEERNNMADANPELVRDLLMELDHMKPTERVLDPESGIPVEEGEASNFGGVWTPGWC